MVNYMYLLLLPENSGFEKRTVICNARDFLMEVFEVPSKSVVVNSAQNDRTRVH